jgi:hypothetical protein
MTVEVAAAFPVGFFIGRAVSFGRLGRRLDRPRLAVNLDAERLDPEHLDGAAGLRPVGDLYFFQAMLLAIPAMYLAVWWFLIPLLGDRYSDWRSPYIGLLAFVLTCEILGFLLPLRSFHVIMKRRKLKLLGEADAISQEVTDLQRKLRSTLDEDEAKRLEDALSRRTQRYQAIESMPTWPVGVRVRRRFALSNILLFIPVVAQALGAPESWLNILEDLQQALSGQS